MDLACCVPEGSERERIHKMMTVETGLIKEFLQDKWTPDEWTFETIEDEFLKMTLPGIKPVVNPKEASFIDRSSLFRYFKAVLSVWGLITEESRMRKVFRIALIVGSVWASHPEVVCGGNAEEPVPGKESGQAALLDSLSAASESLAHTADSLKALVDSLLSRTGQESAENSNNGEENIWEGSFGLGGTLNRGNSRQSSLISTVEIERTSKKTRLISKASVTTTSSSKGKDANKGIFKTKFEFKGKKLIFYFSSLDVDYDRQAGIDLRVAPGLGLGVAVISSKRCRLELGFGANPITEYLHNQPNRTKGHYLSNLELKINLSARTTLDQSITYKPRAGKLQEYLLNSHLSLTHKLTSNFNIKLNLESVYNSRPPENDPPIRRQDWLFYTTVAYSIW